MKELSEGQSLVRKVLLGSPTLWKITKKSRAYKRVKTEQDAVVFIADGLHEVLTKRERKKQLSQRMVDEYMEFQANVSEIAELMKSTSLI